MKKEELFEGAIVLARKSIYERRSRYKVLEVGDRLAKVKKDNITFYTGIRHLRPAKITPKSLIELGFKEKEGYCATKGGMSCFQYYTNIGSRNLRVILKKDCSIWGSSMIFGDYGTCKASYIHEVQRITKKSLK